MVVGVKSYHSRSVTNVVAVCHTMWLYAWDPKFGCIEFAPLGMWTWLNLETRPRPSHAAFDCC